MTYAEYIAARSDLYSQSHSLLMALNTTPSTLTGYAKERADCIAQQLRVLEVEQAKALAVA